VVAAPFSGSEHLRRMFAEGLAGLLDAEGLGPYLLVLANAVFDPGILDSLQVALRLRFETLAEHCRHAFSHGHDVNEPVDDLLVFLKLIAVGFENIEPSLNRRAGLWEVQFNQVRSFRPKRISESNIAAIQVPFNPQGFHFNKPFLGKEVFWSGRLHGLDADLFYNKFPFVDLHMLLVPNRRANEPQFLSRPYHLYVWELAQELGAVLPGVGFGYNSYGAFASVNHLHFQMFVREQPLPLVDRHWLHNGGDQSYPTLCERYDSPTLAWERLDELHRKQISYNLIYLSGRLYCLPRVRQGSYQPASWCGGQAWYEMAGGVVAFNRQDFDRLDAAAIEAELQRMRPG
jgi:diadenosine tetraphosphate (Ap4A) HIT family hydrolase